MFAPDTVVKTRTEWLKLAEKRLAVTLLAKQLTGYMTTDSFPLGLNGDWFIAWQNCKPNSSICDDWRILKMNWLPVFDFNIFREESGFISIANFLAVGGINFCVMSGHLTRHITALKLKNDSFFCCLCPWSPLAPVWPWSPHWSRLKVLPLLLQSVIDYNWSGKRKDIWWL